MIKKINSILPKNYLKDYELLGIKREKEFEKMIELIFFAFQHLPNEEKEENEHQQKIEELKKFLRRKNVKWLELCFQCCCIIDFDEMIKLIRLDLNKKFCLSCLTQNKRLIEQFISLGANSWNQALKKASHSGNMEVVELIISKGANNFNDALKYACSSGNKEVVELIFSKGVNNPNNAFFEACKNGNKETIEYLISKGADDWDSALSGACYFGEIEMIEMIISKGADDWDKALVAACTSGNIEVAKKMIKYGANNLDDCLFQASKSGKIEMVELLINSGANSFNSILCGACKIANKEMIEYAISKGAHDFRSAMRYCLESRDFEVIGMIEKNFLPNWNFLIVNSVYLGNIDVVEYIISKGVNQFDEALKASLYCGNLDIFELLFPKVEEYEKNYLFDKSFSPRNLELIEMMIEKGADNWNIGNYFLFFLFKFYSFFFFFFKFAKSNKSYLKQNLNFCSFFLLLISIGLCQACSYDVIEMVDLMIQKGANDWDDALGYACESGNIETVKKLIEKGAKSYSKSLPSASRSGNIEIVKLLIEKGANSFDKALETVVNTGNMDIIKLLIEKGAKSFSNYFITYCFSSNKHLAEFLIEKGIDINFKNFINQTAFQNAVNQGYYPIITLLIYHGASLDIKQTCKKGVIELIEDAKNGKLWNTKRAKYFPNIFQAKLSSFLLSIKTFSKRDNNHNSNLVLDLKIPRPILYLIIQIFLQEEIELNKNKRNKEPN